MILPFLIPHQINYKYFLWGSSKGTAFFKGIKKGLTISRKPFFFVIRTNGFLNKRL